MRCPVCSFAICDVQHPDCAAVNSRSAYKLWEQDRLEYVSNMFWILISHLVSHLVRLHHWHFLHYRSQEVWQQVPELAANGFSGLVVHEEIHPFGTDLFKLILEGVYSFDFDCTVRQTVPSIQYTDREEIKSCIACTVSFNQFPTVATGVSSIS